MNQSAVEIERLLKMEASGIVLIESELKELRELAHGYPDEFLTLHNKYKDQIEEAMTTVFGSLLDFEKGTR